MRGNHRSRILRSRLQILQQLCSVPTAPFVEDRVVRFVEEFVKARPRLRLSKDRFGNLLITLRRSGKSPRWVFTAHMDHPGFVAQAMIDPHKLRADFRGGVDKRYFRGSKVRFFDNDREIPATVLSVQLDKDKRPRGAILRVASPVAPNTPGMWDQGIGRVRGRLFLSRV